MAAAIYRYLLSPLSSFGTTKWISFLFSFGDGSVKRVGELRHEALVSVWGGTEPSRLCRAAQSQPCTAILCINSLQVVKIVSASLLSLKCIF
jgi:hypothetical protein